MNITTRTAFYRVAQEALTINDNGKSFAVKRVLHLKKNKRLGLLGMRERVEMVGGNLRIESTAGSPAPVESISNGRAGGSSLPATFKTHSKAL